MPAPEVRAALPALNGPDVPYRVPAASPGEKADLVAECRVPRVGLTLKARMRLIPEKREVRTLEERWEKRTSGQAEAQYGRGHAPAVYRQWGTVCSGFEQVVHGFVENGAQFSQGVLCDDPLVGSRAHVVRS
ncbi:hypothetical protein [Streptomyces nogalater]|uniref:Uncharacterized protein n=1 Tax=Streptomyces nogalater TaxID=38314 RepID=A0ABW0WKN6_STRNO